MNKILISLMLFISVEAFAQESTNYEKVDSISYEYFKNAEWDKLIQLGDSLLNEDVDFKRLRQRMGYAYFVKGKYYDSSYHYEQAFLFDEADEDTNLYLYYCGLYTNNDAQTRFYASKLSEKQLNWYEIKPFKIIEALDCEYNYKSSTNATRSDPTYIRLGLSSKLGFNTNLYQSVSYYKQFINSTVPTEQTEYFAKLNFLANSQSTFDIGYHYLKTTNDSMLLNNNMGFAKYNLNMNRFKFGISGSILNNTYGNTGQLGIEMGISLAGKLYPYLKSAVYKMFQTDNNRIIFSQSIGALITKKLWIEGNLTLGDLTNYSDHDGLYVYNSIDPTTFRTGGTFYWYVLKKITLVGNYTFDIKHIDSENINYNQHSFTGGLIWKF